MHIHNPNINITGGMANALTNVGVGVAIGAGMSAGATIVKNSALPVAGKLGIIIAGGVAVGVITTGTSAAMRISNSTIKKAVFLGRIIKKDYYIKYIEKQ